MNIFIVGPMGSGKSTVGKIISDELFLNFFDTDDEIEAKTGASIDWIFDLEGENGFRKSLGGKCTVDGGEIIARD